MAERDIVAAILRLLNPAPIHYNGMLIFAVVGVAVNLAAALFTRHGDSLNQRAVSLHMLEDVLGWVVVLIGALVMKFVPIDGIQIIDPIMSIGVAIFIVIETITEIGWKKYMQKLQLIRLVSTRLLVVWERLLIQAGLLFK